MNEEIPFISLRSWIRLNYAKSHALKYHSEDVLIGPDKYWVSLGRLHGGGDFWNELSREGTISIGVNVCSVREVRGNSMKKALSPQDSCFWKGEWKNAENSWEDIRELPCFWKSLKNPSWNRKPLKGTQETAQRSLVDKLVEMPSPIALWLLEHKNA